MYKNGWIPDYPPKSGCECPVVWIERWSWDFYQRATHTHLLTELWITREFVSKEQCKKNSRLFTIFSRLYLYFPDFFQAWKTGLQISRLFQEFKTLYEPCKWNREHQELFLECSLCHDQSEVRSNHRKKPQIKLITVTAYGSFISYLIDFLSQHNNIPEIILVFMVS